MIQKIKVNLVIGYKYVETRLVKTLKYIKSYFNILKRKIIKYYFMFNTMLISHRLNKFKQFSMYYGLVSIILIYLSIKYNYFNLSTDPAGFFLTAGAMLGSILALTITIHFFYVQNFSKYNSLIFVYDVNNSRRNYFILGLVGISSLLFFFLGGNSLWIINYCPDKYLLPLSLFILGLVLWSIVYFFYSTTNRLSPKGIIEDIEKYFSGTLSTLQIFEKINNKYAKVLGFDTKRQSILSGENYLTIGWYKLEGLCDTYMKLLNINEYRLSYDFLFCLERCFSMLIKSYGKITISYELTYLVEKTDIDTHLRRFIDRIDGIILLNISNNDIQGTLQSFILLRNITLLMMDINYKDASGKSIVSDIIFSNQLIGRKNLFLKIISTNNEEGLFQWNESIKKLSLKAIQGNTKLIHYIDDLLRMVNLLSVRAQSQGKGKTFLVEDNYVNIYLYILSSHKKISTREFQLIRIRFFELLQNKETVANFFEQIWRTISISRDQIYHLIIKNKGSLHNLNIFVLEITFILEHINKLNEEVSKNIPGTNWVCLLIEELGVLIFNLVHNNLTEEVSKNLLDSMGSLINSLLNSNIFQKTIFSDHKIFDQIGWLLVWGIHSGNKQIYNKSLDIFRKYIEDYLYLNFKYSWGMEKYFLYAMMVDYVTNHSKYIVSIKIFFKKYLSNIDKKYQDLGKKEIIKIINQVDGIYNINKISSSDYNITHILIEKYFKKKISTDSQKKIMYKILRECEKIYT